MIRYGIGLFVVASAVMAVHPLRAQSLAAPTSPAAERAAIDWHTDPHRLHALSELAADFLAGGSGQYVSVRHPMDERGSGASPAAWVEENPSLAGQFNLVFEGVPSAEQAWQGGLRMFAGCKPHDCLVKVALVTDSDATQVKAAALISPRVPKLTIFYPTHATQSTDLTDQLVQWARANVVADRITTSLQVALVYLH